MSPSKGEGSSHRKGKEIAFDNLAAKAIGEDAPLSESERFDEEEGRHDPNNECAPLIDPWYDTYAHFSKVSSKYFPSSPGRVWLSICHRNTEVSWAFWLHRSPISSYPKVLHSSCPFSSNLGQVPL